MPIDPNDPILHINSVAAGETSGISPSCTFQPSPALRISCSHVLGIRQAGEQQCTRNGETLHDVCSCQE